LYRITKDPDFAKINVTAGRNCRNVFTHAIGSKLPPMVTTLNGTVAEPALRKRHASMGAIVAKSKGGSAFIAAKDDPFTGNPPGNELPFLQDRTVKGQVPQVLQKKGWIVRHEV